MIYADFKSILEQEDNEKWNTDESHTTKYQKKTVAFIYGYKLACVDDQSVVILRWRFCLQFY